MISDAIVNPRRQIMRSSGFWIDKTMDDFMAKVTLETPDKEALVAYRDDQGLPQRLMYL